jgi:hypothetical protein
MRDDDMGPEDVIQEGDIVAVAGCSNPKWANCYITIGLKVKDLPSFQFRRPRKAGGQEENMSESEMQAETEANYLETIKILQAKLNLANDIIRAANECHAELKAKLDAAEAALDLIKSASGQFEDHHNEHTVIAGINNMKLKIAEYQVAISELRQKRELVIRHGQVCKANPITKERDTLQERVKRLEGIVARIKPATLDRNFWSRSIEILCIDAKSALDGGKGGV